ncbi:uncharacterized protein LOC141616908 [Silene latifolia]|uniref:uncharacterized protein LOC141616908 n=1 Tax=Silene latifolia TaxID=37657 RepID=UPI003D77D6EA
MKILVQSRRALLTKEEEEEYYKLLVEYKDVFAWSYKEMPGLSPKLRVHRLAIEKESILEINLNVALGRSLYLKLKKRDLNDACPKDDFPLPVTELMIDATTGHEALSFMDCTAGYNQIHMALKIKKQQVFEPQKESYATRFLRDHPVPAEWELSDELPGEEIFYVDILPPWQMYFDGAARRDGAGAGVVFISPQNHVFREAVAAVPLRSGGRRSPSPEVDRKVLEEWEDDDDVDDDEERNPSGGERSTVLHHYDAYQPARSVPIRAAGEERPVQTAGKNATADSILASISNDQLIAEGTRLGKRIGKWSELAGIRIREQEEALTKTGPLIERLKLDVVAAKGVAGRLSLISLSHERVWRKLRSSLSAEKAKLEAADLAAAKLREERDRYKGGYDVVVAQREESKRAYRLQAESHRGTSAILAQREKDIEVLQKKIIPRMCAQYRDLTEETFREVIGELYPDGSFPWPKFDGLFDDRLEANEKAAADKAAEDARAKKEEEFCSNNVAEYQALILGLQMAIEIGVRDMDIYGDSQLVISQVLDEYELADALANLAATLALGAEESMQVPVCNRWAIPLLEAVEDIDTTNMICVYTVMKMMAQPIIDFLDHQKLPDDPRHKVEMKLFQAMHEAHYGICGAHQSGPKLYDRVKRMGYYWPTMVQDCMDFAKKCQPCQFYANFIHQPPEPLHPTVSSWPFEAWGLDIVGPLTPKASNGQEYILAGTDHFSKWAEAITLREVKKENVREVQIRDIKISHRCTTLRKWLGQGFNKTLCNLLRKVVAKSKRDWHERIGEALWAYRTTYKTPTQATPYALVYGVEAVLPLEMQIPSLRIAIQEELTEDENDKLRLAELEALDEKRLDAQLKLQCYQARMSRAFNKKVRPRSFQVGDLVLAIRRPIITSHKPVGKFTSKWDGPYVVQEVYTNGAYKIADEDGVLIGPINGKFLKRYYS